MGTPPGRCAMRGTCGKKGWFGQDLPCPYDGPPSLPLNEKTRNLLTSVCGEAYADTPVCCTRDQVEALGDSLQQAEGLISACPACRNNFRDYYCSFTCSPRQAEFVNISRTQITDSGETAVKSLNFYVADGFGEGFFNSCKDIKFGATNGYAMDLIGGGAKHYRAFLEFMGQEKPGLGSPFQMDFPTTTPPEYAAYDAVPRSCSDSELSSRCACVDCPSICKTLPEVLPPNAVGSCHVGAITCLTFIIILAYSISTVGFIIGYLLQLRFSARRAHSYEPVALSAGEGVSPSALGLVGASAVPIDGEASSSGGFSGHNLGRGASLLDPMDSVQPRQYKLNAILRRVFHRVGFTCASYPWLTFAATAVVVSVLNMGWHHFAIETDPVRLWVSPTSESRLQKEFFDEHFGPFYKVEQIFVTPSEYTNPNRTVTNGWVDEPVLTWDRFRWWFDIEADIRSLRSYPNGYHLSDVCFKPSGPDGACVVQSVAAWFNNELDDDSKDSWRDQISGCAAQPGACLPDFGQPLAPEYVLGGVPPFDGYDWLDARSFIVTYVISDSLDPAEREKTEEWERTLRKYLDNLATSAPSTSSSRITYSTGVSLEEEINKSTNTDVKTVIVSYVIMFLYISLTLGSSEVGNRERGVLSSLFIWAKNFPRLLNGDRVTAEPVSTTTERATWFPRLPIHRLFVGSKFTLGLFGIALVIVSVSSSVGMFSFVGIRATLIIAEVIPFLVLAVGVDNVFILVHELDRQNAKHGPSAMMGNNPLSPASRRSRLGTSSYEPPETTPAFTYLTPEERVARAVAKMGPSILLSTVAETLAFALGALVPMPAVRNFAMYAAGSVFLNAVLQVTVFVSALTLDLRRVESHRVDCFPCIRVKSHISLPESSGPASAGMISRFFRTHYATFLLRQPVKAAVLALFGGIFAASVISMQHIQLGLDQRLALPAESYLIPYFDALEKFLDVGPPVYFVSTDVDVTGRRNQQHLCGRFTTCDDFSIANVLEAERKRPESSFISQPTAVWIDDFFRWLDPQLDACCRVKKADPSVFCQSHESERFCRPCFAGQDPAWNITMQGLPEGPEFTRYLKQWLISPTDAECSLGGQASFGSALSLDSSNGKVVASHFRTSHSPLKTQADFINAFAAAHRIADEISRLTGTNVFPYSFPYVFFDQYAHIIGMTQEVLGLGLASVLLVTTFFLGSWRTGTIVTGVVALTVVNVMGVMGIWGIDLNAISLVNLVISLGIAVEFCSHIARAFMNGAGLPQDHPASDRGRAERVWVALVEVGPSVLSGITFTKLIGISVLALTRSKLLEIYYFRMWLTLIISGALHGLVFLPVVLSFAGGQGYALEDADEEWMSSAVRRNEMDFEYAPFASETDSVASD